MPKIMLAWRPGSSKISIKLLLMAWGWWGEWYVSKEIPNKVNVSLELHKNPSKIYILFKKYSHVLLTIKFLKIPLVKVINKDVPLLFCIFTFLLNTDAISALSVPTILKRRE